jgi:hypothetical protein
VGAAALAVVGLVAAAGAVVGAEAGAVGAEVQAAIRLVPAAARPAKRKPRRVQATRPAADEAVRVPTLRELRK